VTIKLFEPVKPAFRKTMTFDNGRGFCGHEKLSESSELKTFFANPYHSWERGLNEHTNGLIREFYPKSTNFNIVKEEDFQRISHTVNILTSWLRFWLSQKAIERCCGSTMFS